MCIKCPETHGNDYVSTFACTSFIGHKCLLGHLALKTHIFSMWICNHVGYTFFTSPTNWIFVNNRKWNDLKIRKTIQSRHLEFTSNDSLWSIESVLSVVEFGRKQRPSNFMFLERVQGWSQLIGFISIGSLSIEEIIWFFIWMIALDWKRHKISLAFKVALN